MAHTNRHTHTHTHPHTRTWPLYDQPGSESRVGEKWGPCQEVQWPLVYVLDFVKCVLKVKVFNKEPKKCFLQKKIHETVHHKTVYTNVTFTT